MKFMGKVCLDFFCLGGTTIFLRFNLGSSSSSSSSSTTGVRGSAKTDPSPVVLMGVCCSGKPIVSIASILLFRSAFGLLSRITASGG